jgi:hypothetical protein
MAFTVFAGTFSAYSGRAQKLPFGYKGIPLFSMRSLSEQLSYPELWNVSLFIIGWCSLFLYLIF